MYLMQLHMYAGAVQEVHRGSETLPSIVVVTPEDSEADLTSTVVREAEIYQPAVRISSLPLVTVRTARPPLPKTPPQLNFSVFVCNCVYQPFLLGFQFIIIFEMAV